MRPLSGLVAALLLAGCGREGVLVTYDQRWTGPVTPDQPACGEATSGTLTLVIATHEVTFTPNDGVMVLRGTETLDGAVHATLTPIGQGHHPYPLTLEGRLTPAGFTGTYATPHCRYHVVLGKPNRPEREIFSPKNPLHLPQNPFRF